VQFGTPQGYTTRFIKFPAISKCGIDSMKKIRFEILEESAVVDLLKNELSDVAVICAC
jgi:hypothetical protein